MTGDALEELRLEARPNLEEARDAYHKNRSDQVYLSTVNGTATKELISHASFQIAAVPKSYESSRTMCACQAFMGPPPST